jgi:Fe-S-cluster containining protein
MLNPNLSLVNLEGYSFSCLRCGKCCKVLAKTELCKKELIYRYDYQGKLSKSPFTTTTIYYNEKKKISKHIGKNLDMSDYLFTPYESLFLKDYPIEFIYSYQVKTNGKWCIFYDINKRSCNIYPTRPLVCKTYPLYIDRAILGGTFVDQPNISKCTSVDREIKKRYPHIQNIMNVRFDPKYSTYEKQFPKQSEHFKIGVYMKRKVRIFFEVWINLFMNPIKMKPNMVRKYDRLDMSQFWSWLSENKENLDKKKILTAVRTYKQKINELNKLFNLNINDFL